MTDPKDKLAPTWGPGRQVQGGTAVIPKVPVGKPGTQVIPVMSEPRPAAPGAPAYAPPVYAAPPAYAPPPVYPPPQRAAAGGEPSAVATSTKKSASRWPLVLALVVCVLGVVSAGGFFLFKSGRLLTPGSKDFTLKVLIQRELDANPTQATTVDAGSDARIVLPPRTLTGKTKLSVSSVAGLPVPASATLGNTVDVRLGDLHQFEQPITVELPYAPGLVQGRIAGHPNLVALSYSPERGAWEPVPFTIDEARKVLRVSTTHLSMFSSVNLTAIKVCPTARIEHAMFPYFSFEDAATAENILKGSDAAAAEEGWKFSMEWFGISQAVATLGEEGSAICQFGNASAALGKVNELAGNLGVAFALVQFGLDMSKPDNKTIAVGNALKAIGMDALGRWGTSAIKIAGVGVFAIDYSLGKFIDRAWSQRKDIWVKAFACFYQQNPRNNAQWLMRFKALTNEAKDPAALNAAIRAEVENYSKLFWEDETEQALCQSQVGATNSGSGGGLNEAMEKSISEEYAHQLFVDLQPVFAQLSDWVLLQQQQRTMTLLGELQGRFNQQTLIHVVLRSKDPNRKLEGMGVAITTTRDPKLWAGAADKSGVFDMTVTNLGYMLYGSPKEVVVTLPAAPGAVPEQRRQTFTYVPGRTVVEVQLDGAVGTFDGEMKGSYSGPGIDGVVPRTGPIHLNLDAAGVVTATFTMNLKFTAGRGQSTVTTSSTGSLTGKLESVTISAQGTVRNQYSTVINIPGMKGINKTGSNSAPVRIEAHLVGDTQIEGTLKGGTGARDVPFTASKR